MKNAYLIANYLMVPADRMQTSTKDWMKKQDSVKYNEQITFARNLKTDDLQTAKVILDLKRKKIVKNSANENSDYDELFDFYNKYYAKQIEQFTSQ
tara:strand:+ start:200 stop:487 length:288 start_codon:yes stop_codon:yes gene_type:complete